MDQDEYLSDVPSYQSQSDVSQDLLTSARILEQLFKEKYKILKNTYETRLEELSNSVAETCQSIVNDEVLKELKRESASAIFIPAHVKEVIENHLQDDREKFLQKTLTKLNKLESELNKSQHLVNNQKSKIEELESSIRSAASQGAPPSPSIEFAIEPMQSKLRELHEQFEQLNKSSEEELHQATLRIHDLQNSKSTLESELESQLEQAYSLLDLKSDQIAALERELEAFSASNMSKSREIEILERSSIEFSKELMKLESTEAQLQALQNQSASKIDNLTAQNNSCLKDLYDAKARVKYLEEEIVRQEKLIAKKDEEQAVLTSRMSALMVQVETMLNEEALDTNATIKAYQEKITNLKHSSDLDLQKEKRLVLSLTDELTSMRNAKEISTIEFKHVLEEKKALALEVKTLQDRLLSATRSLEESSIKNQELKMTIKDLEVKIKAKDDVHVAALARKELEIQLIEEKTKLHYEKQLMTDMRAIEQRYSLSQEASSRDRQVLSSSVELIKSSLELAPGLFGRSLDAQQHQFQALQQSYQQEQNAKLTRERDAAESRRERIERESDSQIHTLQDKILNLRANNDMKDQAIASLQLQLQLQNDQLHQLRMQSNNPQTNQNLTDDRVIHLPAHFQASPEKKHRYLESSDEETSNPLPIPAAIKQTNKPPSKPAFRVTSKPVTKASAKPSVQTTSTHLPNDKSEAIATYQIMISNLEKQLKSRDASVNELQTAVAALNNRLTESLDAKNATMASAELANSRLKTLTDENLALQSFISQQAKVSEEMSLKSSSYQQTIASLTAEITSLTQKLSELQRSSQRDTTSMSSQTLPKETENNSSQTIHEDLHNRLLSVAPVGTQTVLNIKQVASIETQANINEPNEKTAQVSKEVEVASKQLQLQIQEHQNEIRSLRNQLEEQRQQELRDQEQYTAMLTSMKRKFDSLLQLHDQTISSSAHSSDVASAATIQRLKDEIEYEKSMSSSAHKDVAALRQKVLDYQNEVGAAQRKTESLKDALASIQVVWRKKFRDLKVQLSSIKVDVSSMQPTMTDELRTLTRLIKSKTFEVIQKLTAQAKTKYDSDLQIALEKCRSDVIRELHVSPAGTPVRLRSSYDSSIVRGSREGLNVSGGSKAQNKHVFENDEIRKSGSRSIFGGSVSSSREGIEVPQLSSDIENLKPPKPSIDSVSMHVASTSAQPSDSSVNQGIANISNNEAKVRWYEGLVEVVFDTIVNHGIMTKSASAKLQSLIVSFLKTSKLDTHTARQLTSIKWILTEELQRSADSTSSSRILLAGELEQSRQEHMLLLELSKLESDSRIQAYESKVNELQSLLEDERNNHSLSIQELEKRLRRIMEDTVATQRQQDSTRIETLRQALDSEEAKRKAVQTQLKEKEKLFKEEIRVLEEKNISLLSNLQDTELQLAKLKMEHLHR